jgi:hypothetical protein
MKKNLSIIILFALFFQSCQTIKPISLNEAEVGKKYEVKMMKGSQITGKLKEVANDTIVFNINNHDVKLPVNKIEKISRVKVKKNALIIGSAVVIGGIILISKNLPENDENITTR